MATPIKIPDIGTTVDHVRLIRWLKEEGDEVERGEPICEVETDKAASELESVAAGVLLRQTAPEDSEVEQGEVIGYVGAPGEEAPAEEDEPRQPSPAPPSSPKVPPLIRNLAEREGVDLSTVVGTGPGDRITRADVLAAKGAGDAGALPRELSPNQRAVGRAVAQGQRESVPFSLVCRIDMTAALQVRERLASETGGPVPLDPIFIHALSRVLPAFPEFMSRLAGDVVTVAAEVNIGFLAALKKGLVTLVVENADRLSPAEVHREVRRRLFRAARGKAPLGAASQACFTISNLAKYPVHSFHAVLPPGQSAILAIGAVEDAPVLCEGQFRAAPLCHVTLTVDHRLINGSEAGRFLARLKEVMETL